MSKLDTAKNLFRLSLEDPSSYVKAAKYAVAHGLVGLRDRFHEELVKDDVTMAMADVVAGSADGPVKYSILMPTYNVDVRWVEKAIASVEAQSYANWELLIADDASQDEALKRFLLGKRSDKVKVRLLEKNGGISRATNEAAAMATGDYLVPLDNDDVLSPVALELLSRTVSQTSSDILYTDHNVVDADDNPINWLYKPDWSPDLMLSQMYLGHLLAFKRSLFECVGGFDPEFDGAQDYDLVLRMLPHADVVSHVPEALYSWRSLPTSTATNPDSKPYAQGAGQRAIRRYLDGRYGKDVCRVDETDNLFVYDVRYPLGAGHKASIVMPTKDHMDDVEKAVASIYDKTEGADFEILVMNNNSVEPDTAERLAALEAAHENLRVIDAPYQFNWSKINNQGIREATGDVLVFLNNDVEVISPDWLVRLMENALRQEVGAVGPLLLFPDGTIQHAGVVVGMNGWADHVYSGCAPVHCGDPFISPMVRRDVSAVTGACMAVSRDTLDAIGPFDERFIVCGSDVELCLRAMRHGLYNVYLPEARLTHYESKTRDPKDVPPIDFELSEATYREIKAVGDPFYNVNLDIYSKVPTRLSRREKLQREVGDTLVSEIPEIRPLNVVATGPGPKRLNLLLPSVNPEDIYGGISTALKFFDALADEVGCERRIVVLDGPVQEQAVSEAFPGYHISKIGSKGDGPLQIVDAASRQKETLEFGDGDWFIATCWWSAYILQEEFANLHRRDPELALNPLVYLIQDYEPGFYAWSTNYLLSEATYRSDVPTVAVFNSEELHSHLKRRGYEFAEEHVFSPQLNPSLQSALLKLGGTANKKRQILVYGRPDTPRNAFDLLVAGLRLFVDQSPEAMRWEFLSAGEQHRPVSLGKGRYLTSVGKQSLEGYARLLEESYAGVSLMVSPHPSYPPLEMAAFGVQVVTNCYGAKDLSGFSKNMHSLKRATPQAIADALTQICAGYQSQVPCGAVAEDRMSYLEGGQAFPFLGDLARLINGEAPADAHENRLDDPTRD